MIFTELFKDKNLLIGIIHTNSNPSVSMLNMAKKEIEMYLKHGVYPLVENYYGSVYYC